MYQNKNFFNQDMLTKNVGKFRQRPENNQSKTEYILKFLHLVFKKGKKTHLDQINSSRHYKSLNQMFQAFF